VRSVVVGGNFQDSLRCIPEFDDIAVNVGADFLDASEVLNVGLLLVGTRLHQLRD